MNRTDMYAGKDPAYYGWEQAWVADLVVGTGLRVLDVGCGAGATGALLKQTGQAAEVHGIELVPEAAERARDVLDVVHVGNIEEMALPYEAESFDCIIATELLEHLVDPWETVKKLADLLKPGGYIIASSPNIREIRTLLRLAVLGRWDYVDSGILDRTHLRFFTRRTFGELFTGSGLEVDCLQPLRGREARMLNTITMGMFGDFLTRRYAVRARRA